MNEMKSPKKHHLSIWGIILVFLGVVFLLQNFGLLPRELWVIAWRFWPVILIIVGINIFVGRYKPWLAAAIVLAVLALALFVALWLRPPLQKVVHYSALRGDFQEAVVELDFRAGDLNLSALPAGSTKLVEANSRGDGLTADSRRRNSVGFLRLESTRDRRPPWERVGMGWTEWKVELTRDIPLTIEVKLAAANVEFDLCHIKATRLDLELNAGQSKVRMPSGEGVTRAFIEANAANIEITIPKGVAARIETNLNAGALEIDESRFPRKGAYFISPDFEDAESRIYIKIDLNAGRAKVL